MSNPPILFRGIPRTPTRSYTADIIRVMKPARVVIPCTGSFSLAWAAREAGLDPARLFCGDISLYSTALGHAIMDQDFHLALRDSDEHPAIKEVKPLLRRWLDSPVRRAAAVCYAIRLLQHDGRTQHKRDLQRELVFSADQYLQQLWMQITEMADFLRGLTYRAQDMWQTLDDFKGRPDTLLLVNPPRYTGGYDRMFAGIDAIFEWDEPHAAQFTEKDYDRLMNMLEHEPSTTMMYYATQGDDPALLWGAGWRSIFADMPASRKTAAINWIVANRNPAGIHASRARLGDGRAAFRLFDGDLTPDSQIAAVRVQKEVGDYYRDLFIHKLPGALTEVYVALLVDGCLGAIIGLHLADLRRGKVIVKNERVLDHCASITFAFTVQHDQYPRLHKLTLGSIVSSWFWGDVLGDENWYAINGAPRHVKTVMLTKHPENKTARGILRLDLRDHDREHGYKLHYSAEVIERSRRATLDWWYKHWGHDGNHRTD